MLPPDCRLPFLVARFLQLKHLNMKSSPLPFKTETNPLIGVTLAEDDPCTIVFTGFFSGNSITDGYYSIHVYLDPALEIPQKCLLSIMHWTIDFENQAPMLTIIKASVTSTIYSPPKAISVPVENNPRVFELLQKLRHQRILLRYEIVPEASQQEFIVKKENTGLFSDSLMSDAPDTLPQVKPIITPLKENKPISLGFGSKSKEKTAELKAKREVRYVSEQEDLMEELQPSFRDEVMNEDYGEDELFREIKEDEGIELNKVDLDVGIEEFPPWALDYLKFFYKVA